VRKHGASTASRRAAPPSARFQRDRPEVGGVTHIVVVYDIWPRVHGIGLKLAAAQCAATN